MFDMAQIARKDADNDGALTADEFISLMIESEEEGEKDSSQIVEELFDLLDTDNNGAITTTEFINTLKTIGEVLTTEEVNEIFAEVDHDGNGELNKAEFKKMVKAHLAQNLFKYNFETSVSNWLDGKCLSSVLDDEPGVVPPEVALVSEAEVVPPVVLDGGGCKTQ